MDDNDIPWPQKGDTLFKSDSDWWNNSCLNFTRNQWHLYAEGYKVAADILSEHIITTQSNQDILIYPIVFLYRQFIELKLKEIIIDCNALFGSVKSFPQNHDIKEIWHHCRELIEHPSLDERRGDSFDFDIVENYISQLSAVDPGSFAFRYPIDKSDKPTIPNLRLVNIRNFSEIMQRLNNFLDCVNTWISVELDAKSELIAFELDANFQFNTGQP